MFDHTISSTFEQLPDTPPLQGISFGQATHPGRLRDTNEDHLGSAPDLGFFVVTDGVGGAPAGAVAARLATAAMLQALRGAPAEEIPDGNVPVPSHGPRLCAAALLAHNMIRDFAARNGCQGAATTMAALWVAKDHVHAANTGDSRVYRLAGEGLEQLSKDHTAVQEALDAYGPLSRRMGRVLGNVVTQVLGGRSSRPPVVHLASMPLTQPEVFLICTDGLTNMVQEEDIAFILKNALSPQHAADVLVEVANEEGGLDNITCIVVHASPQA